MQIDSLLAGSWVVKPILQTCILRGFKVLLVTTMVLKIEPVRTPSTLEYQDWRRPKRGGMHEYVPPNSSAKTPNYYYLKRDQLKGHRSNKILQDFNESIHLYLHLCLYLHHFTFISASISTHLKLPLTKEAAQRISLPGPRALPHFPGVATQWWAQNARKSFGVS